MIIQEISRKMGLSLLPEEEKLKTRFEAVSATVNSASFKVINFVRFYIIRYLFKILILLLLLLLFSFLESFSYTYGRS